MRRSLLAAALIALAAITSARSAHAVPRPEIIDWLGSPRAFVISLYRGVLGREPETEQVITGWAQSIDKSPGSRIRAFWQFVGSPEYKSKPWSKHKKEWVAFYRNERKNTAGYCHCYYVTRHMAESYHIVGPSDKKSKGVARAVARFHAAFDPDVCRRFSCGWGTRPATAKKPPVVIPGAKRNPDGDTVITFQSVGDAELYCRRRNMKVVRNPDGAGYRCGR